MATDSKRARNPRIRPKIKSLVGVNQAIQELFALDRAARGAALSDQRSIVHFGGMEFAIIPLHDLRNLERLLEQEKEEDEEFDRIDIEEAERILADPTEISIPYEQVRRELGFDEVSD